MGDNPTWENNFKKFVLLFFARRSCPACHVTATTDFFLSSSPHSSELRGLLKVIRGDPPQMKIRSAASLACKMKVIQYAAHANLTMSCLLDTVDEKKNSGYTDR